MVAAATQHEPSQREALAGLVERLTFHNEDNGFCVLRVKARGHRDLVTVVGHAAMINPGEFIQASGAWVDQSQWQRKFDLVLEIFTIQALPPKYEKEVIQNISNFVAPGGQLLVIAEVGREERSFERGPPWLLTPEHIDSFVSCGLKVEGKVVEKNLLNDGEDIYVTTFNRTRS